MVPVLPQEKHLFFNFASMNVVAVVDNQLEMVYNNKSMNSSASCCALRHWYRRETDETLTEEIARLQNEMANLQPMKISEDITVRFVAIFCMCDQKVMNKILPQAGKSITKVV